MSPSFREASRSRLMAVLLLLSCSPVASVSQDSPPNIVFVVIDDVGWADISYTGQGNIPTPHMDKISRRGVRLTNYYVHPTCTPTRASLFTGLYSYKTGLSFAIVPGSPAGLSDKAETMPKLFRNHGYSAAASGKWHLGYSQPGQLPTGRGFEKWIGCVTCNFDPFSKQTFELPWHPMGIDWSESYENKTHIHRADPRHSTHAITENAIDMIADHKASSAAAAPLFLYVAYTAAHSPLQPMERHMPACQHIGHAWRRKYCGLVVGLDEALKNLTAAVEGELGSNTVMVVMSDNGGSPWFGGLNAPFRGGKTSPYEGGVHVPAFLVDFSQDKRYFGPGHREYSGLFHVSDWLPTLANVAGIDRSALPTGLDGINQREALQYSLSSPRFEVIFDLIAPQDAIFSEGMISLRRGDIKIIDGLVRDSHWYSESSVDRLNTTDDTWISVLGEVALRSAEYFFGNARFDTAHHVLAHGLVMHAFASHDEILLFNITEDPSESNNLVETRPDLLQEMLRRIDVLLSKHVVQEPIWMTLNHEESRKSWVPGDCSQNPIIPEDECLFLHTWAADSEDPLSFTDRFDNGRNTIKSIAKSVIKMYVVAIVWAFIMFSMSIFLLFRIAGRVRRRWLSRVRRAADKQKTS